MDTNHSQLDQIRCSPLDRRVDGRPLGKITHRRVLAVDISNLSQTSKQCASSLSLARFSHGLFDEPLYPLVAFEIPMDELLSLMVRDSQFLGQAKRRLTINDPKVN